MAYNTGNPLGSKDPRDLYDNTTNFDKYSVGADPMYPNRFGVMKLSIEGQQQAFQSAQDGRAAQFEAVLAGIGFVWVGDYGTGVTFETRQQYTVRGGLAYTVANDTTLPFTLTGTWATDQPKLKLISSDQILRNDLANGNGSLVGIGNSKFLNDLLAENGSTLLPISFGAGTVQKNVGDLIRKRAFISIADWMTQTQLDAAEAGTLTDDLASVFASAYAKAVASLPATVVVPDGTFRYSAMPNWGVSNLTFSGNGMDRTILKYTGSGVAFNADAFANGQPTDPLVKFNVIKDFTVEGNANVDILFRAQGVSRSIQKRINVREGKPATGVGFSWLGHISNNMQDLFCSVDVQAMTNKPYYGMEWKEGRRANGTPGQTDSIGNSSNNITLNLHTDGLSIGQRLVGCDQLDIQGGASQSNSVYGMTIGVNCRYNSFRSFGLENPAATADVADGGVQSEFGNCYCSNKFLAQGRQTRIRGGYIEAITADASIDLDVSGIVIRHWQAQGGTNPNRGGIVDNGVGSKWGSIWNVVAAAWEYPKKSRYAVTLTANQWVNNTHRTVKFIIASGSGLTVQTGVVGDLNLESPTTPNAYILRPGDLIQVAGSPGGMSVVEFSNV